MVSIICSTCNLVNFKNLLISVNATIGCDYEVIKIDNYGKFGICQAYNKGLLQAKYDIICFVHDDVVFRTENWGNLLIEHFQFLENPGIIGFAGSTYKGLVPSSWHHPNSCCNYYNLIQGYKYSSHEPHLFSSDTKSPVKVITIDGFFISAKRCNLLRYPFNELLSGFHGYDTDISIRFAMNFNNYFVPNILTEHHSGGKINEEWLINQFKIADLYGPFLPRQSIKFASIVDPVKLEFENLRIIISLIRSVDMRFNIKLKLFIKAISLFLKSITDLKIANT